MDRTLVILGVMLCASGCGSSNSFSKTQRIVEDREIYAAAADPKLSDGKIAADAKSLCKVGTDWCMVVVVPNGRPLPTGFPLSDAEAPNVIGFYTLNRASGMDGFKRGTVE